MYTGVEKWKQGRDWILKFLLWPHYDSYTHHLTSEDDCLRSFLLPLALSLVLKFFTSSLYSCRTKCNNFVRCLLGLVFIAVIIFLGYMYIPGASKAECWAGERKREAWDACEWSFWWVWAHKAVSDKHGVCSVTALCSKTVLLTYTIWLQLRLQPKFWFCL